MYSSIMNGTNQVYVIKTSDDTEIQQCEIKKELEDVSIQTNNVITIRSEDGSEITYVPVFDNGRFIMTPISIPYDNVSVDEITEIEIDQDDIEKENVKISESECNEPVKKPKLLTYGNKIVRAVPIPEPSKSTRVPPNTYKKYLNEGKDSSKFYNRKRVIIDQQTKIGPKMFKQQLIDSTDLVRAMELAPKTKKEMTYLVDKYTKIFGYPCHSMTDVMRRMYTRHCTTLKQSDSVKIDDMEFLPVGYQVEVDRSKIKRITRRRKYPDAEEYTRQKHKENVLMTQVDLKREPVEVILGDDCGRQILFIHEEETVESTTFAQKNIEVLLAAAAESSDKESNEYQQVLICSNGNEFLNDSQIIIVEQDEDGNLTQTNESTLEIA